MRLWSLHPCYLDAKGLGALWFETLLALAVLQGKTKGSRRGHGGWTRHPQLDRWRGEGGVLRLRRYARHILRESRNRGYKYNGHKIRGPLVPAEDQIQVTRGQVLYEFDLLAKKVATRGDLYRTLPMPYKDFQKAWADVPLETMFLLVNDVFKVVEGPIEKWERVK